MNISTPEKPKIASPLKLLLMGEPGSRKTTLGLQFPDVHVLDCDQNLDGPIKALLFGVKDNEGKVAAPLKPDLKFTWDSIRVDDNGKILDISECFDRVCDKLQLFTNTLEYKARRVVFLDSLSHVNEFIIRKILKMKSKASMEINLWTDFASGAYTLLVARLDQTGKPVICSVHLEKIAENDPTNFMRRKIIEVNPLFSGRVGDNIGAYFTDVWLLEKRLGAGNKVELWLTTDRTPKCAHLKNSVGLPNELNVTKGFSVLEPYLKGRI